MLWCYLRNRSSVKEYILLLYFKILLHEVGLETTTLNICGLTSEIADKEGDLARSYDDITEVAQIFKNNIIHSHRTTNNHQVDQTF
jgi:hypothetical protein